MRLPSAAIPSTRQRSLRRPTRKANEGVPLLGKEGTGVVKPWASKRRQIEVGIYSVISSVLRPPANLPSLPAKLAALLAALLAAAQGAHEGRPYLASALF
jgi:hypothetical protein